MRSGSRGRARSSTARASAVIVAAAAAAHARRTRLLCGASTGACGPMADPPSAIHFSSLPMSWALCHRSSGSLARQVLTIRSKAGGAIGETWVMGSGWLDMIAEISDAWLVPENAFLPVAIS